VPSIDKDVSSFLSLATVKSNPEALGVDDSSTYRLGGVVATHPY